MRKSKFVFQVVSELMLGGCTQLALAPSVSVMPAPGKPFDLFVNEEALCRRFAEQQTGVSKRDTQRQGITEGALTGAAVGAAAGTAFGALAGDVGGGAAIGAGAGLLEGTAIGAGSGERDAWRLQRSYDIAYEQCMYAKGNQIAGFPTAYSAPPLPPPRAR